MAEWSCSILSLTLEIEPHHQIQFSFILRIPLFDSVLPLFWGYSQYIVSPCLSCGQRCKKDCERIKRKKQETKKKKEKEKRNHGKFMDKKIKNK